MKAWVIFVAGVVVGVSVAVLWLVPEVKARAQAPAEAKPILLATPPRRCELRLCVFGGFQMELPRDYEPMGWGDVD